MNQHLSGLPAWLVQRLSALYMLAYVLTLPFWLHLGGNYQGWRGQFAHPASGTATLMFALALLLHSWVGVRDIVLDYTGQRPGLRLFLLALLGGTLIAIGLRTAVILLRISL